MSKKTQNAFKGKDNRQLSLIPHQADPGLLAMVTHKDGPYNWELSYDCSNAVWLDMATVYKLRNKLNEWLVKLERRSNKERRG